MIKKYQVFLFCVKIYKLKAVMSRKDIIEISFSHYRKKVIKYNM